MRPSEIAATVGDLLQTIDQAIHDTKIALSSEYTPPKENTNNEEVSDLFELNNKMCEYIISSTLSSIWTKKNEETKKQLDEVAYKANLIPDSIAGQTVIIIDNGSLTFSKRQNKDSEFCTLQDFIIELQKLDVDKKTIEKATLLASKPKRGNVYYMVTGSDT